MAFGNCPCGGSMLDRFQSLFTCSGDCSRCHWTLNTCCNGCYGDTSSSKHTSDCINFYDINFQNIITSKIRAFGYCDNHKALGIKFANGNKKIYLNVERDVYDGLLDLNKDLLFMFLENNIGDDNQCINIP